MRRETAFRYLAATSFRKCSEIEERKSDQTFVSEKARENPHTAILRDPKLSLNAKPLVETCPFKVLKFHTWQTHCVKGDRSLLPSVLLYHGNSLGPRPLLLLDHSFPSSLFNSSSDALCSCETQIEAIQKAAEKYVGMLSRLAWQYGAVYIPLVVSLDDADVVERSCKQVCGVMDALDIRWSHFLTYSYGTLVAARLAASEKYPHRIGSFISLDTPLVTTLMTRNAEIRAEIGKAEKDVNVPAEMLAFAREELLSALEKPLPCPAPEADGELYEKYLFDPKKIYERGGLIRKEDRYVPLRHLSQIYHPFQLIAPTDEPLCEVSLHKHYFRLSRPGVIKSAKRHKDLFSEGAAPEIANVLTSWMNRFEPDMMLSRKYDQAAKEMLQLVSDTSSSTLKSSTMSTGGPSGSKRKKEKKQKMG